MDGLVARHRSITAFVYILHHPRPSNAIISVYLPPVSPLRLLHERTGRSVTTNAPPCEEITLDVLINARLHSRAPLLAFQQRERGPIRTGKTN